MHKVRASARHTVARRAVRTEDRVLDRVENVGIALGVITMLGLAWVTIDAALLLWS